MAEPALRRWRRAEGLLVVVEPGLAPLVEDAGLADVVFVYDRRGSDRGWRGLWRAAQRLRAASPGPTLVLGPSLRAAALAALAGARPRRGCGGEGRELFLDEVIPRRRCGRQQHLADRWWAMADGERDARALPRWSAGPAGRRAWRELRVGVGLEPAVPYAVFAVSAAFGETKRWPLDSFVELARRTQRRFGLRPVAIGGPATDERAMVGAFARACGAVDLGGRTTLPALAALLEEAALFVGNDSGPMHLAAATGVATLGIFGSTDPAWTAPRGVKAAWVGPAPVDCTPCFRRHCPFDRECLRDLGVDDVESALEVLLSNGAQEVVHR